MSSPLSSTSPASLADGTDSCIRLRIRRNVDLPQPDGPISAVTVRAGMASETRSSTFLDPNHADTLWASKAAAPLAGVAISSVSSMFIVAKTSPPRYPVPADRATSTDPLVTVAEPGVRSAYARQRAAVRLAGAGCDQAVALTP